MSSSVTISSGGAERGFVLATTLLVTTLLTVMLAASFLLVSAEQRTTLNSFGTARALALAQAGLQIYFDSTRFGSTTTYDSAHFTLTGGYADVVARQVRPGGATTGSPLALWVVRSTGVSTNPVMTGQVVGSRTIAQFAQYNPGVLPTRAAMVALNGVRIIGTGGSNPLYGVNFSASVAGCTNPSGTTGDTVRISAPLSKYNVSGVYQVSPYDKGIETSFPSPNSVFDSTHIDWAGLIAGNFIPDYIIPSGAPSTSPPWPTPSSNIYLLGYVPGNATIPASSGMRGMLVVSGNVAMASGAHWDGIILAGGSLSDSAGGIIHGMVVTGLNYALGQTPPQNNIPQGGAPGYVARVQWSYCYAQGAVNSLASLVPMKNAWVDTWSTY